MNPYQRTLWHAFHANGQFPQSCAHCERERYERLISIPLRRKESEQSQEEK